MKHSIDSKEYDKLLLKLKNDKITDTEARRFFDENFVNAAGASIAMAHIDSSDEALADLSEMNF